MLPEPQARSGDRDEVTAPLSPQSQSAASDRIRYRAELWHAIFRESHLPKNGSVLEICPGESPKIAEALRMTGFTGSLSLLEPSVELGERLLAKYRALLPAATIKLIPLTLRDFLNRTVDTFDAVVGNHPIDDLILGEAVQPDEWDEVWGQTYSSPALAMQKIRSQWELLENDQRRLVQAESVVLRDLVALKEKLDPALFVLFQYPSTTLTQEKFSTPDLRASDLLKKIRNALSGGQDWNQILSRMDQDPEHWCVATRNSMLQSMFQEMPEALQRLGSDAFIAIPARADCAPETMNVITDSDLTGQYGGSAEQKREALAEVLTIDLFPRDAQGPITHVYVDYQVDPTGIALGPNLGSGRAAYVGLHFNLKGLGRTPLAKQDENSVHGTGRVNLFKGAWEMIFANTVRRNFWSGGSGVIALGFHDRTFPLKGEEWVATNVLREDFGSLDRPAHALRNENAMSGSDLLRLAHNLGRLDGEQFVERILHNAWSVGNFSIAGQLIDFDTASAVRGRCPHFSYNAKFPAVLFGYEGEGKMKVLETLIAHQKSCANSETQARNEFEIARSDSIRDRLPRLLGISGTEAPLICTALKIELAALTHLFLEYSPKMVPDVKALNLFEKGPSPALFDFSRLFRYLPAARQTGASEQEMREIGLRLLLRPAFCFTPSECPKLSTASLAALEANCIVHDQSAFVSCITAAETFVELFCAFSKKLDSLGVKTSLERAVCAYRANEDRRYLEIGAMNPFLIELDHRARDKTISTATIQRLIEAVIIANDRTIVASTNGTMAVDTKIFWEGKFTRLVNGDGTAIDSFTFFPENSNGEMLANAQELIKEESGVLRTLRRNASNVYRSAPYDFLDLFNRKTIGNACDSLSPNVGIAPVVLHPIIDERFYD